VRLADIMLRADERVEWIMGYPEDFQQILCDMLAAHGITDSHAREAVVVSRGDITAHYEEFESARTYWSHEDHERVAAYTKNYMNGAVFPPLIAEAAGTFLIDGYHRLCMYSDVGDTEADFIYLNRQPMEIVDAERELSGGAGLSEMRV